MPKYTCKPVLHHPYKCSNITPTYRNYRWSK